MQLIRVLPAAGGVSLDKPGRDHHVVVLAHPDRAAIGEDQGAKLALRISGAYDEAKTYVRPRQDSFRGGFEPGNEDRQTAYVCTRILAPWSR